MNGIEDGRMRVVIEGVTPEIDGGRFPIRRTLGEHVAVEADIFADGRDAISAVILHRREDETGWDEAPMVPLDNDRWRGGFVVTAGWRYRYTLQAWVDRFKTWRNDLNQKVKAGQDVTVDLLVGAELIAAASRRASECKEDKAALRDYARRLRSGKEGRIDCARHEDLAWLMERYPDKDRATVYDKELMLIVDREKARFSTWYEIFPRSCSPESENHGTFKDCERRLPYVAAMGFDVLYLPPIHPVGRAHRKGKNNVLVAGPDDPGSPWAIGSKEGGHKDIHPALGTLADFQRLVAKAAEHGLEVAMDIAFQCTPDHPYVQEHPEWFRHRPDGTIQYAENPPKKYEDIYPLDFETDDWKSLWEELEEVFLFWIKQGVRIFRVDNPHTKPFTFWEHVITSIKKSYPDVIFLAEAFTRPRVMCRLAKLGFTQSYTYFAWRNTKWEIMQYFTELTQTNVREFLRPNLWPNTPDILTEYLQFGGRAAFMARIVLAATLGANYGIYGPAFELCENRPVKPGSEEYLNSEKYEIKHWDVDKRDSLREFIGRVNRIRKENLALQSDWSLRFYDVDNEQVIGFTKQTADLRNVILTVVNLDPHHTQGGWVELPLDALGLDPYRPYQVHDLITDARYLWQGGRNYVELNPHAVPAHIFRIRHRTHTEQDFDYYM